MQEADGIMFKGDASHKVTKLVYVNTDEKVYHGLCTLMNEFGEVLQDLVTDMLGKKLQKPESIRLSEDWTNVPLKEEQITSAALDAYAGIHVYWAIFLGQDPIFDDCGPTAIEPGSKANVYDSTGSNVIATGIVADQISGSCREYRQTVTNGREVVTIIDIVIPCALIPIALSKNGTNGPAQRWTIDEHERNDLLVNKKNVRPFKTATVLYAESLFPLASTTSSSSSPPLPSPLPLLLRLLLLLLRCRRLLLHHLQRRRHLLYRPYLLLLPLHPLLRRHRLLLLLPLAISVGMILMAPSMSKKRMMKNIYNQQFYKHKQETKKKVDKVTWRHLMKAFSKQLFVPGG
jgi:hypothetical protein